jgi:predicted ATPase/DNA-binding SARP family transcriptional activator
MRRLEINLLGPFEVRLDGSPVSGFESSKVRALLAILAAEAHRPQRREALAALLWPDWPQKSAMSNLRYALADLRKNIADKEADPPFLLITRETIQLNLGSDCRVDVMQFEQALGTYRRAPTAVRDPQMAVELYRSDFLEGFSLADSPAFEVWARAKTEYYRQQVLQALEDLVKQLAKDGDFDRALIYARHAVEIEPWHEPAHQQVMRILARLGRRAEALAQFERLRVALQAELKIDPSPETQALLEQLLSGTLQAEPQPAPVVLAAPTRRDNLPAQLTSFIGRQQEIAIVQQLLQEHRLVTLTGSGGVGKTRLALQVAIGVLPLFPDGVWLVELASLTDPALVPQTAITALGIQAEPGHDALTTLLQYLQDENTLLVLDNCEHLIDACASLSETILKACPAVHFLVTSREVLGVSGESVFEVPSMHHLTQQDPDPGDVLKTDAGQLFVERAVAVMPGFVIAPENTAAIAKICCQLDGIPLAIELAAARINLLSVEEIAARLDDRFSLLTGGRRTAMPRHKTLRAAIDWSWDLLTEQDQKLLRRLSVFAGGWTLQAAEVICSDEVEIGSQSYNIISTEVIDGLSSLVNKSLVVVSREPGETARYQLLETVRQYLTVKLAVVGEVFEYRTRHRDYFLNLAELAEPELKNHNQLIWLNRLESEYDNLRASLGWSEEEKNALLMLRQTSALHRFWLIRGFFNEGRGWIQKALKITGNDDELQHNSWYARALLGQGDLMIEATEDLSAARSILDESRTIFQEIEDRSGLANVLFSLANLDSRQGKVINTQPLIEKSLKIAQTSGDKWLTGKCLNLLSHIACIEGEWLQGRVLIEESVANIISVGDRWELMLPMTDLVFKIFLDGEVEKAIQMLEDMLVGLRQLDAWSELAMVLTRLAYFYAFRGNFEKAQVLVKESLSIVHKSTSKLKIASAYLFSGIVNFLRGDHRQAHLDFDQTFQYNSDVNLSFSTWIFEYLGQVLTSEGMYEQAIELLEKSLSIGDWGPDSKSNKLLPLGDALRLQGNLERALVCYRESLELQVEIRQLVYIPARLEAFAKIAAIQNQPERAARLFGAARTGRERFGTPLPPVARQDYNEHLTVAKAALGEGRFAKLYEEGRTLTFEQAVALALDEK